MVENPKEGRKPKEQSGRAYIWLNRGIACLLLFAAGMKVWQLATVPVLGEGLLHARWFNILVVEFELFWAIWLLFGLLPKLTRWATIGLFSIFTAVSIYKALSGEASCGCFGQVQVNPWWTGTFDLLIVALLALLSRGKQLVEVTNTQLFAGYHTLVFVIGLWLFSGIFCYAIITEGTFQSLVEVGQVVDTGETVRLEPVSWIDKEFPLVKYIIPRQKEMKGVDFVLIYQRGCPACEEIISLLYSAQFLREKNLIKLEIRPSHDLFGWKTSDDVSEVDNVHLTTDVNWFVETPTLLKLHNNIVVQVITREELRLLLQEQSLEWRKRL